MARAAKMATLDTAKTGWVQPSHVKPDNDDEVQPEESASCIGGLKQTISASYESSFDSSVSAASLAGQSGRCFS